MKSAAEILDGCAHVLEAGAKLVAAVSGTSAIMYREVPAREAKPVRSTFGFDESGASAVAYEATACRYYAFCGTLIRESYHALAIPASWVKHDDVVVGGADEAVAEANRRMRDDNCEPTHVEKA